MKKLPPTTTTKTHLKPTFRDFEWQLNVSYLSSVVNQSLLSTHRIYDAPTANIGHLKVTTQVILHDD